MSANIWIWSGLIVGSTIGGIIPDLLGAGMFSFWSIVGTAVGAGLGIYFGYKMSRNY